MTPDDDAKVIRMIADAHRILRHELWAAKERIESAYADLNKAIAHASSIGLTVKSGDRVVDGGSSAFYYDAIRFAPPIAVSRITNFEI